MLGDYGRRRARMSLCSNGERIAASFIILFGSINKRKRVPLGRVNHYIRNCPCLSSVDNHTSVGMQRLTGNEATILACKEDETGRNFAGLAWSAHRCATELLLGFGGHCCRNERSPDYPKIRSETVYGRIDLPGPGHTQLTRIPFLTCWLDKPRVKATIAPFVDV